MTTRPAVQSTSMHGDSSLKTPKGSTELVDAAERREWEKVEVRRPLEAVVHSECGPTRAVRLGLRSVDP
jgi:hypothetical protein